ncbi:prepilin-type N-terminal cleavage/methylation domain-containing protein [Acinetobacter sp. YH16032]|uniref:prepilin-type N-terminal cleavage/methylation domain-containing protein n=1 Tax=Acinetobacter sp. YH16032 TaxID=2601181 RepID=UPI0015D1B0E1|nr:prepilin-type N-terminal cleavage/methylation domain-containing protein [Acinetobacter sp. YH16032]
MKKISHRTYHQLGFTLVELMITIVVIAILLFMGTSLTRAWIDQGHVDNTISALKNATFQARAAALRNTNNQPSTFAAASVCFDRTNQNILVVRAAQFSTDGCTPSATNATDGNFILQSIPLDKNVNLTVNSVDFNCLAFNSAGILVNSSYSSQVCSNFSDIKITIKKNKEIADVQIN